MNNQSQPRQSLRSMPALVRAHAISESMKECVRRKEQDALARQLQLDRTAIHEASHCIIGYVHALPILSVSVLPDIARQGHVCWLNYGDSIGACRMLLAGGMTEEFYYSNVDNSHNLDEFNKAKDIAERSGHKWRKTIKDTAKDIARYQKAIHHLANTLRDRKTLAGVELQDALLEAMRV